LQAVAEQYPFDEDEIAYINRREEILLRIRKIAQEIEDKVRQLVTTADEFAARRHSRRRLTRSREPLERHDDAACG
jgi:hypothetical protein